MRPSIAPNAWEKKRSLESWDFFLFALFPRTVDDGWVTELALELEARFGEAKLGEAKLDEFKLVEAKLGEPKLVEAIISSWLSIESRLLSIES